jgi:hypothetical protein
LLLLTFGTPRCGTRTSAAERALELRLPILVNKVHAL